MLYSQYGIAGTDDSLTLNHFFNPKSKIKFDGVIAPKKAEMMLNFADKLTQLDKSRLNITEARLKAIKADLTGLLRKSSQIL